MEQAELDWRGSFARLILQMGARQQGLEPNRTPVDLRHRCLICCCLCAPTELNLFNTPIPPWVPGAAKRKHLTEYLTKLGTPLPNEGEARYYSSQSYTVNEGMTFHGTLDDIFKDAPATKPDVVSEEKSELARVAEELQNCQSQLSQLIEHVHGGRDQALPGMEWVARGKRQLKGKSMTPRLTCLPRKQSSRNGVQNLQLRPSLPA